MHRFVCLITVMPRCPSFSDVRQVMFTGQHSAGFSRNVALLCCSTSIAPEVGQLEIFIMENYPSLRLNIFTHHQLPPLPLPSWSSSPVALALRMVSFCRWFRFVAGSLVSPKFATIVPQPGKRLSNEKKACYHWTAPHTSNRSGWRW